MSTGAKPGLVDYSLLIGLSIIWGSSFMLSKIAVSEVGPLTVTMVRQLVAMILLGSIAFLNGKWFRPSSRDLVFILACAFTGTIIPFTLINFGVQVIDAGMAAILMGSMPLTVLIMAHLFTEDEKLTMPKLVGVLLGICGLGVLFWPSLVAGFGANTLSQLAVLGAAFAYAVNALATKQLVGHPPMAVIAYVTLATALVLVPVAFSLESPSLSGTSGRVGFALLALGIFPSAIGAMFTLAIIRRQGASFFSQINLLVPVAGVLLGIAFLGERPGLNAYVALVIIFSGVFVARLSPKSAKVPFKEGQTT